jgi:hypothetical protein
MVVVEFVRRLIFIQEHKFTEIGFEGMSVQFQCHFVLLLIRAYSLNPKS